MMTTGSSPSILLNSFNNKACKFNVYRLCRFCEVQIVIFFDKRCANGIKIY